MEAAQMPPSHGYGMAPPNAANPPPPWECAPGSGNDIFQPPSMDFAMEQQVRIQPGVLDLHHKTFSPFLSNHSFLFFILYTT